jgi:predicted phosphate transport protein (TIGR00153 family)
MRKKNEYNYFEAFCELSKFSLTSATVLNDTLSKWNINTKATKVKEMHQIEHAADKAKHDIMNRLVKEFLPPIEREDITTLTQEIDNVTDSIEDVLLYIDMFNIKKIRPEALKFSELIVKCCKALDEAMALFKSFKNFKALHEKIVEINHLEEQGDALYVNIVRKLYENEKDPIELMRWTEVFYRLERCCDICEDVANVIESIVMKNS